MKSMVRVFENLSGEECELMLKAPFLVCILIAGADGNIDRREINESVVMASKNMKSSGLLAEYNQYAFSDFEDKLKVSIQSYPYEVTQRAPLVTLELSKLNAILQRLPRDFSIEFYKMLRSLAEKIASSSGGVLGIGSIGSKEATLVTLPMIHDPSKF